MSVILEESVSGRIRAALKKRGGSVTIAQIFADVEEYVAPVGSLEERKKRVTSLLGSMARDGYVGRAAKGVYFYVPMPQRSPSIAQEVMAVIEHREEQFTMGQLEKVISDRIPAAKAARKLDIFLKADVKRRGSQASRSKHFPLERKIAAGRRLLIHDAIYHLILAGKVIRIRKGVYCRNHQGESS